MLRQEIHLMNNCIMSGFHFSINNSQLNKWATFAFTHNWIEIYKNNMVYLVILLYTNRTYVHRCLMLNFNSLIIIPQCHQKTKLNNTTSTTMIHLQLLLCLLASMSRHSLQQYNVFLHPSQRKEEIILSKQ